MNKTFPILFIACSAVAFAGMKKDPPPLDHPDFSEVFEKELKEANKVTREEWLAEKKRFMKSHRSTNDLPRLEIKIIDTKRPDADGCQFFASLTNRYSHAYSATSDRGIYHFPNGEWFILQSVAGHFGGEPNAVLLMDSNRDFHTIRAHQCPYLTVFSTEPLEMNSLSNFFQTVSRDGDQWTAYEPPKRADD